jgi:hypothetical protein
MISMAKNILMAVFLVLSVQASAQDLNEASVKEFIAKIDKAINSKNASELGRYISENAQIILTLKANGMTQSMTLTKSEYLDLTRQALAAASDYTYRRSNEQITFSGKSAKVSGDIIETLVMGGQRQTTRSKEVCTIELINGALLITKVAGSSSM